ncbi:hypothetical protein FA95DRAFT_1589022 [Auriscalpium vulgare]|uniref:Uncharacterized protein n=1 Tax=Auriscalpium vulgare TaxID=40419 RepID=A0ACB8RV05_9AGAM|nr:hypothetical protein FA95DRAFT_1589022 [Auriscalpium vulgare]
MSSAAPSQRTQSNVSVASTATEVPSGPLSGPSNTTWRRQRLLHIGSRSTLPGAPADHRDSSAETSPLVPTRPELSANHSSYGTLPTPRRVSQRPSFRARHGLPALPTLSLSKRSSSIPASPPPQPWSAPYDRSSFFRITTQRPISAYDALAPTDGDLLDADAKTNGVRVWYSSFSSIDWLHDAIKDSARVFHIRRRRSFRGRVRTALDKSMGWVIVTIVGFLTAVTAFLIVRSEQWLFDIKDGYCETSWLKAKRFCCPMSPEAILTGASFEEDACDTWRTWSHLLTKPGARESAQLSAGYVSYAFFALLLAGLSALLTIHLTASTSFVTRKDSGVLAPDFDNADEAAKLSPLTEHVSKRKVLYYAAGSGIPEIKTILSGFVIHGYLGGRTLFTKSVGLALSVASGLSLGKEGPFVHIASCIGNIVSRYFSKYETNEGKRREILSAASAAGVAVAFGAPIGGVLFSLEEVSYFFPPKVMWRSFFCAMIAAMTLRFLDPFGTGKLVLFQVTYEKDWHAYELVPFLLLGVFGGVFGAYFSKLNHRWSRDVRNKTWLKTHPIMEVLLVTLVTTAFSFVNPYTRMGGTELVYNLFAECRTGSPNNHSGLCVLDPGTQAWPVMRSIFLALIVKAALTVVTFGIKLPAGIFIPTLGVGACAGRIVGIAVQYAQWRAPDSPMFASCGGDLSCIIPGLYAMVGAAAALSGVTRTTVSLAVIMFELTDTLTYAVPVMLAVLVAKTVADALEPKGIYDLVIELSQLPYLDSKHQHVWGTLHVSDATDRDVDVIRVDRPNTVKSLRDQLADLVSAGYADTGFPIVRSADTGFRLAGYIGASELEHALSIVADEAEHPVYFQGEGRFNFGEMSSSSLSSIVEDGPRIDPFNFSVYMDQAPLTVNINSPLEIVQQFFVKLGARYVVVTDSEGHYEGVIDKNGWLTFLGELDAKLH